MVSMSRLRATLSFVNFGGLGLGFIRKEINFCFCFGSILGKGLKRADHMWWSRFPCVILLPAGVLDSRLEIEIKKWVRKSWVCNIRGIGCQISSSPKGYMLTALSFLGVA